MMKRMVPKILGLALLLAVLLCLIVMAALRWTGLAAWLTNRAIDRFLEPAVGLSIDIQDVGGNLFDEFAVEGVEVRLTDGRRLAQIPLLALEYDGRDLIRRRWRLKKLTLGDPVLYLLKTDPREPDSSETSADPSELSIRV